MCWRTARLRNPESATTTYVYDNNGNRTQRTDASGNVTNYGFDPLNSLLRRFPMIEHFSSPPFPPYPSYYLQPRQKPPTLRAIQGVEDRASHRPSLRKWHRTPSTPAATRSPRLGPKPSPRPNPSPLATANRTRTNWTNPWRSDPNTLKRRQRVPRSPARRSQNR